MPQALPKSRLAWLIGAWALTATACSEPPITTTPEFSESAHVSSTEGTEETLVATLDREIRTICAGVTDLANHFGNPAYLVAVGIDSDGVRCKTGSRVEHPLMTDPVDPWVYAEWTAPGYYSDDDAQTLAERRDSLPNVVAERGSVVIAQEVEPASDATEQLDVAMIPWTIRALDMESDVYISVRPQVAAILGDADFDAVVNAISSLETSLPQKSAPEVVVEQMGLDVDPPCGENHKAIFESEMDSGISYRLFPSLELVSPGAAYATVSIQRNQPELPFGAIQTSPEGLAISRCALAEEYQGEDLVPNEDGTSSLQPTGEISLTYRAEIVDMSGVASLEIPGTEAQSGGELVTFWGDDGTNTTVLQIQGSRALGSIGSTLEDGVRIVQALTS